jgi:hypothetical protein
MIPADLSSTALQPVLQLSALTHLQVTQLHVQLALLRLRLPVVTLTDPALLQLTALTALEDLRLSSNGHNHYINLQTKIGSEAH